MVQKETKPTKPKEVSKDSKNPIRKSIERQNPRTPVLKSPATKARRTVDKKGKSPNTPDKKSKEKKTKSKGKVEAPTAGMKDSVELTNKKWFCAKIYERVPSSFLGEYTDCEKPPVVATTHYLHLNKARYKDIICGESTRVILKGRPPNNDFYHANWATMPDGTTYIGAQGPMDSSLEDFWHMVVTELCPAILMLCDFVEDGKVKCVQYIPLENEQSAQYGMYKVTRKDKTVEFCKDVVLKVFEVSVPEKPEIPTHTVQHFQYQNWRDYSAPVSTSSAITLYKTFKQLKLIGPPIVHCSAGVGRTCTFIGLDLGHQRVGYCSTYPPIELVHELRKVRDKAIQSTTQYMFMVMCLLDIFIEEGVARSKWLDEFVIAYKCEMIAAAERRKSLEEKKKVDGTLTTTTTTTDSTTNTQE
ncbi:hypothetical protein GCK72_015382 [Caenorhabditis remanei]|uniref:Uncharacterized protein n=1 Tax=Caenorhabditis remanei TaxID=31234 RepID=A0A6A5GX46_CAERE|nr:hypothetical protein GCK72_015382 [Caenorhabditis remanei]KAF1758922.1 hypothetical protein GCK72_015382 [Caenorhabditis remanei]